MFRRVPRSKVLLTAVAMVTLVAGLLSSSRMFAHTPGEQVIVSTFGPSFITGYHYGGGFTQDDLDPRTPAVHLQASVDLQRMTVATDRYILSVSGLTGLAVAIVDRATGAELPRPRTSIVGATAVVASPDGRYAYLVGSAPTGTQTVSVIDLRPESSTFDTEIRTVSLPANGSAIGMAGDSTGTRLFVLFNVTNPTPANARLMTIDTTTPFSAALIKNAPATQPTYNVTPGFEQPGSGRLHTFLAGGAEYLLVPRRQTQVYRVEGDGSLTYVQSLPLATPGIVRDAIYTTTAGSPRVYALTSTTTTPFPVNVVAYDMSIVGPGFAGSVAGQATIDTQTAAEGSSQIAASLDGSRLYVARSFNVALPGTLMALDAAAIVTNPATAVLATQGLTGINSSPAQGLAVTTEFTPSALQPSITGVAVDGVPGAILINNAVHTLTVTGTHLDNIHQAFIGLARASVVSASSNSVTLSTTGLVPANTSALVLLGNDGSAATTITVANAPDYVPQFVVYAASTTTNKMSVLNAATGSSVIRQFASGLGPADAAPTADGRFLVVANFRGNGVTIHSLVDDPAHGFTADQIVAQPTFVPQPQRIVVSPTRKRAYAAGPSADGVGIVDLDPDSPTFGTEVGEFITPASSGIRALAISPDGNTLYITRQSAPQLLVADISTDTVPTPAQFTLASPTSANGRADGLAMSPDGTRLYFMNAGDSFLRVFDTSSPMAPVQIQTVALPAAVAGDLHRIQVLPNNRFVYVSSRAKGAVDVFDTSTNAFVATVTTGAFSSDPAVSRNSQYVFVGVAETDAVLTLDARETINGLPNPNLHHIIAATGAGTGVTGVSVSGGMSTSGGTDITVTPAPGVSVTFPNVTTPGLTTASASNVSNVALPPFYFNGTLPVFVSIDTNAIYSGAVTVCLTYDASNMTPAQEAAARVLHLSGGAYVDVTSGVDTVSNFACGQSADLGQFVVALYDGDAPVITTPANQTAEASSASGATATFAAATAVDPLSGLASLSCDRASGQEFAIGVNTVTCTAIDNVGRAGSASFTISVVDTTPPTIGPLSIAPVTATSAAGAVVTYVTPTATDAVDGPVAVVCAPASGSAFPIGNSTVVCTATDAHGNASSTSATATVDRVSTTTVVTCPSTVAYTGLALTPCSATVTGAGGFTTTGTPSYGNNTAVGTATASFAYAGDASHAPSTGSATFAIAPAPITVKLTAASKPYDGTSIEPDANMSCTLVGVASGETVTCAASNGSFGSALAGAGPVTATVTIGGTHVGNYTLGALGTTTTSTTATATAGGTASTIASAVYGQNGNFNTRTSGTTATTMNQPYRVAVDSTGGLYVAEEQNHRVLYFPSGTTTPSRVYGQNGSFTSGTSNNGGLSATSLSFPRGLAVDSADNLYIVDGGNHRVLFFPTNTMTPTRVYGQGGVFTTGTANKGGISATSLNDVSAAAVDATGVYLADQGNNRVLFYSGTSTTATRVYGQNAQNFTTNIAGVGANLMLQPSNLVIDSTGGIYISDYSNNRVLYFPSASTTPTRVYGQSGNFTTNNAGTSATQLRLPRAAAIDAADNLYIADQQNHRVLFFPSGSTTATRVYGQGGSFTTGTSNNGGVSAASMNNPLGGAIAADGTLYIADLSNNRVLRFSTAGSGQIVTAPVTATLTAAGKLYDATTTEPNASMSCTLTGVLPADAANVSCTATAGTFNSAAVGARTVTATVTISGSAAGNYTLGSAGSATSSTTATASANITIRTVTATITGVSKVYDGSRNATITCALSGLAPGDSTGCAQSANALDTQFASAGVGAGKAITASNLQLTNNGSGNYTLSNTSGSTTATIQTRAVTAKLTAAGKTYDGTATEPDANMSCALTGAVAGDAVSCVASNGAFNGAAVGSGNVTATMTLAGTSSANYTLGSNGTAIASITGGVLTSTTADLVYGQNGSFNSAALNLGGVSATSVGWPQRVAVDANGGLYMAQEQNNRVLYYPAGSTTATVVYGQGGSFTTNTINKGGAATGLFQPRAALPDANGNVYIVDSANNRVLFYPAGSTTPTRVYGQSGSFSSTGVNSSGLNANSLNNPNGVALDAAGNVYISDTSNNRVLMYAGVSTTATRVYGQNGSFSTAVATAGANGLNFPTNLTIDSAGNLYISDYSSNRVLMYAPGSTTATRVYGQNGNFNTTGSGTGPNNLSLPRVGTVDANDNLYIADQLNHRVLFYPAGSTTATRVYGQNGNFNSATCNLGGVTADSLCGPHSVAISADGLLYIADQNNNRVLRYSTASSGKITRAPVTATFVATDKPYDGTAAVPNGSATCTVNGVIGADAANVSCAVSAATFDSANAGSRTVTATVTLSGSASGNYTLGAAGSAITSQSATTTASIIGRTVTAVISVVSKIYDGTTSATATCALTGVLPADSTSCAVSAAPGDTSFDTAAAGIGRTVTASNITLTNNEGGNYSLTGTTASTTANILTKSITATLTASGKPYDGTTAAPNAGLSCALSGVLAGDAVNVSCAASNGAFDDANAGARAVSATLAISGAAAGNYTLGADGSAVTETRGTALATITRVASAITFTCPATTVFTGAALTPCTATVTSGDIVGSPLAATYTDNVHSGTATASVTFDGDANHEPASDTRTFTITPAASVTTVTCPTSVTFDGTAQTPCTATVTGAALATSVPVTYTNNINGGTATASASFAGDADHTASSDSVSFQITGGTSAVVLDCAATATFTGSTQTACTATVTGAGGLSTTVPVTYTDNVHAGTATASATFDGDANHTGSSATTTFTIARAASTTTVLCPATVGFNGSAQTPCTASVAGAGGLTGTLAVTYANNGAAGTATASASFDGDADHLPSSNSTTFEITGGSSTVTLNCPATVTFTGAAQTACTATVTGAGGLNQSAPVTYSNNVNTGTATASATFAGDASHTGSSASATFAITQATSTTTVTCPTSVIATGSALTPCSATTTGAGGLNVPVTVTYVNNAAPGTATASATFSGDVNHLPSTGSATFAITAATAGVLDGNGQVPGIATLPGRLLRFDFSATRIAGGLGGGSLSFWTTDARGRSLSDITFDSTSVTSAVFSDDPAFTSGKAGSPSIDTVQFTGTGTWGGQDGYTLVARATDQGEPGAGRDTFTLTVSDSNGVVVLNIGGTLTSGNVASSRLPGRNGRPLFLTAPSDLIVEATSAAGAMVIYPAAVAVDSKGALVTVVCDPVSGATLPMGRTRGVCTATDSRGATRTAAFTIRVVDRHAPVFSVLPTDMTLEADRAGGAVVTYAVTATDAIDAAVSIRCTTPSGRTFPIGTTAVTCTATDDSGNSATTSFNVTVRDTTAPVFTTTPANVVSEATSPLGDSVNCATPRATDVADPVVTVTCSSVSGSTFPIGVTPVTCTGTDNSGNSVTTSFTVTVRDTTAPRITITDPAGSYGLNAVVFANYTCTDTGSGVASCTGTVANHAALNTSVPGTYTFTVTAVDAAGNTATRTVSYTVRKK